MYFLRFSAIFFVDILQFTCFSEEFLLQSISKHNIEMKFHMRAAKKDADPTFSQYLDSIFFLCVFLRGR